MHKLKYFSQQYSHYPLIDVHRYTLDFVVSIQIGVYIQKSRTTESNLMKRLVFGRVKYNV